MTFDRERELPHSSRGSRAKAGPYEFSMYYNV
jgi:hypothetical protein